MPACFFSSGLTDPDVALAARCNRTAPTAQFPAALNGPQFPARELPAQAACHGGRRNAHGAGARCRGGRGSRWTRNCMKVPLIALLLALPMAVGPPAVCFSRGGTGFARADREREASVRLPPRHPVEGRRTGACDGAVICIGCTHRTAMSLTEDFRKTTIITVAPWAWLAVSAGGETYDLWCCTAWADS
jgi:hypothetical protein